MGSITLPLPIPNAPTGSAGVLLVAPPQSADFRVATPAFSALTLSTLGNAGDPSDGFESDLAALAAVTSALDAGDTAGTALLVALDAPLAELLALGDEINDLLLAGTAVYDASESGLITAVQALSTLGAGPALLSLPALPGLPSFPAPVLVDLTQEIQALATSVLGTFESQIESQLDQLFSDIQILRLELESLPGSLS